MKTRFPARTALVTALALAMGAPAFGGDDAPQLLAQATFGGGGPNSSSGTSGTSSSETSGTATTPAGTSATTGTTPIPGDVRTDPSAPSTAPRGSTTTPTSPTVGSRPGTTTADSSPMARMQQWWSEHRPRWNEPAPGNADMSGYESNRPQGWGPGVQPGASATALTPRLPESDNAQAQ